MNYGAILLYLTSIFAVKCHVYKKVKTNHSEVIFHIETSVANKQNITCGQSEYTDSKVSHQECV